MRTDTKSGQIQTDPNFRLLFGRVSCPNYFMRLSFYLPLRCYFSVLKFFVRQLTRPLSFEQKPSVLGIMLRTYLKRPEWLYYPGVEMDPVKKFTFTPPSGADPARDRLCEHLI